MSDAPQSDPDRPRYWFPAKTFGYGWGLPITWEGWGVFGVFLALLVALIVLVPADRHPTWFSAGLGAVITSLIAICWWTGEPLRWRWGKRKRAVADDNHRENRPDRTPSSC